MTTMTPTTTTTQVYRVYIKATAQAIWTAITDPEWTDRYGYTNHAHYDLRPGGHFDVTPGAKFRAASEAKGYELPDVLIDGDVIEADPPHKLVTTFRMLMDPQMAAEGFTRITHEIKELPDGTCSLTLTHELENAPTLALIVGGSQEQYGAGGGHAWVLSDLKTLLETGKSFNE
ncbi:MAG: SRPBCC domain-containing protein [Actinomycetota bacterium]